MPFQLKAIRLTVFPVPKKYQSPLARSVAMPPLSAGLVKPSAPAALRDELQSLLTTDLLGPISDEEEIPYVIGRPRDRYLVGVLAPHGTELSAMDQPAIATAGSDSQDDGSAEDESAATNHLFFLFDWAEFCCGCCVRGIGPGVFVGEIRTDCECHRGNENGEAAADLEKAPSEWSRCGATGGWSGPGFAG